MTVSRSLLFFLLCYLSLALAEQTPQVCVKQVFNNYCLGGTLSDQLKQTPVDMQPMTKGERSGVIFEKEREKIYVMAYRGVIYKILHTYEPDTWLTLKDLSKDLERKYGKYRDDSEYPEATDNLSKQMSYIRRGEGELRYIWQVSGEPWRVELGWDRKLGITVAYFVNKLDDLQKEAALKGL